MVLIWTGCQTAPLKFDQIEQGHWESRILVRDLRNNRSFIVNASINAIRQEQLRVDATSTVGEHLASLVLTSDEVRYVVPSERSFYFGAPRPEALQPILSLPMNPHYLHHLLFDIPLTEGDWSCQQNAQGYLEECSSEEQGLKVLWSDRAAESRMVFVEHEQARIQMNLTHFRPAVEDREELFQLEAPQGFRLMRLRD